MIRKLKPLKQILAENPDWELLNNGSISVGRCTIPQDCFYMFGTETKVMDEEKCPTVYIDKYGRGFPKSWFEPIKEKVQYYQVMYEFRGALYVDDRLHKSESDFIKINPEEKFIQLIPYGEPVDE